MARHPILLIVEFLLFCVIAALGVIIVAHKLSQVVDDWRRCGCTGGSSELMGSKAVIPFRVSHHLDDISFSVGDATTNPAVHRAEVIR